MPVTGTSSGGAGSDLSLTTIRSEVQTELGGDRISVELPNNSIDKAISDAVRVYNNFRPFRLWRRLNATPRKHKYDVTEMGIQNIVRVNFVESFFVDNRGVNATRNPFTLDYYAHSAWDQITTGPDGQMIGEYAHLLAYNEEVRQVTSAEDEWESQWEQNSLFLYVDLSEDHFTGSHTFVAYEATFHYEPDNNTTNGMQLIPQNDVDIMYDLITGESMRILGRIRDKYKGVIGPDGSAIRMDGEDMKREGKERYDQGMEKLRARRRPLGPVIG